MRVLYFLSVPLFFCSISVILLIFMIHRDGDVQSFFLFLFLLLFEIKFSLDVLSHCSKKQTYKRVLPHVAPIVLFLTATYVFSWCYEFESVSGTIAILMLALHILFKWVQVLLHSSDISKSDTFVAVFKYGRLWDQNIPSILGFEILFNNCISIILYNFFFVITLSPFFIYGFNTDGEFYNSYRSFIFIAIQPLFLLIYHTSVIFLMTSKGKICNYKM